VLVPPREARVKQFSFAPLSASQAMLVLVSEDGAIENRVIDLPRGMSPAALVEAGNFMTARLGGKTLAEAGQVLSHDINAARASLDSTAQELIRRGLADWATDAAMRTVLIVRGTANLIDAATAHDLDRVRQLLDEIEGKEELARLLDSARDGMAAKVFIGAENKLFALSGSSVIAAPYHGRDGRVVGVVGVIGPTRLNYARIVPMVDFTAQTLSRLMR
jgi:heat-inducible transcriptional repressor